MATRRSACKDRWASSESVSRTDVGAVTDQLRSPGQWRTDGDRSSIGCRHCKDDRSAQNSPTFEMTRKKKA